MAPETATALPLWRPIVADEYSSPRSEARSGFSGAWPRFLTWAKQTPHDEELELVDPEPVPTDDIAHLVPAIDLAVAATSLDEELEAWRTRAPAAPRSVVLVGPPGSAVQDVLDAWVARTGDHRLTTPTRDELDASSWDPELPTDPDAPLVLPPLERLFLRRAGGLAPLRRLFERLQREGRTFVCACDSWAWSYLSRTLQDRAGFDRVLASAPFTASALGIWLGNLDPAIEFLDGKTGKAVFAPGDDTHDFLHALAARSRGVPGVAASLWRLALCQSQLGSASRSGSRRCRLPSWEELSLPAVPHQVGKPGALLLHALLLHGGLDKRRLATVLPLPASVAQALLWELSGRGIVTSLEGSWRVSDVGYATARAHLAKLNLPLDDF